VRLHRLDARTTIRAELDALVHLWNLLTAGEKVALFGAAIVWVVYRADRWSQRKGLINGVSSELTLHKPWVGKPYPPTKGNWDKTHMPYKLATIAIDDAIVRGPSLFLNRDLSSDLVVYRQLIGHYNQLVDQLMAFQAATPQLWVQSPPQHLLDRVLELIAAAHLLGIGDIANSKAAHWGYVEAGDELGREQTTKVLPVIWAITGFNFFFLKRWGKWI
jgi:hypothetical protein